MEMIDFFFLTEFPREFAGYFLHLPAKSYTIDEKDLIWFILWNINTCISNLVQLIISGVICSN